MCVLGPNVEERKWAHTREARGREAPAGVRTEETPEARKQGCTRGRRGRKTGGRALQVGVDAPDKIRRVLPRVQRGAVAGRQRKGIAQLGITQNICQRSCET